MIGCLAATACLLAPAFPAAGAGRPLVSLVATPSHVVLAGRGRETIHVQNTGVQRVLVDVARSGFALDLRGRPRIVPRRAQSATSWLVVRPRVLAIPAGKSRDLTVASVLPGRAQPGDHSGLVLLVSRPHRSRALAIQMRLGVVVVVRAPGKIVRQLVPMRLNVVRARSARRLEVTLANRGNVTETLTRGCLRIALYRQSRLLVRLAPPARQLLPRTRGIVEVLYRGPIRGRVRAVVQSLRAAACPRVRRKPFWARL